MEEETENKDSVKTKIENLVGHAVDYAETRIDLTLLNASDKVAATLSSVISAVILGIFIVLVFLFASMGVAWWIGQALNNVSAGYFIMAGFFLIITIAINFLKKTLFKPLVTNIFLKNLYDKQDKK